MTKPFASNKTRATIIGLLVLPLALLATAWAVRPQTELHATFTRADGHYRVEVWRKKSLLPMLPGQAGDAAGVVQLLDAKGKLLRETTVPMVQMVDKVEWEKQQMSIKLIAEWPLPD